MKKYCGKHEITSLDFNITSVQIENYLRDSEKTMNKLMKKQMNNFLFILVPFILSAVASIILKNPLPLVLGTTIMGTSVIVTKTVESVKSRRKNSNYSQAEADFEQILKEGITQKIDSDFYNRDFKKFTEEFIESEQDKKYKAALEKQNAIYHSNLSVVGSKQAFLNKEETMIQIVEDIEVYSRVYTLPPLEITNNEWDAFFDVLYAFFKEKQIEEHFYEVMSDIMKFTLAKILLNRSNSIKIGDFLNNMDYLKIYINNLVQSIDKSELDNIYDQINSSIQQAKIIKFTKYEK